MKKVQNHILIVDDDTRICELLEKFLKKNGYLTTSVHSAEKARRLLSGLAFDLIILDVMMPGESGIELTLHLRKKNKTPILLLTCERRTRRSNFRAGSRSRRLPTKTV
jgi:two-component system phosphate regulon response regulator OmpR